MGPVKYFTNIFSSISDLDLDQPVHKRILGYGNINIRLFLNENPMRVSDINNPENFFDRVRKEIGKKENFD